MTYSAELARRYGDQCLVVTSLHPGVIKTDLHRHMSGVLGSVIVRDISPVMSFNQYPLAQNVMEKTVLHDVSYGALTQLYAGTAGDAAQLNGKVCTYVHSGCRCVTTYCSISFPGPESGSPIPVLRTQSLASSCGTGWRKR